MGQPSFQNMQQQVQKAYTEIRPTSVAKVVEKHKCNELLETIEVDGIDQAYVWVRTFMPSWLMGIILLIGALTVLNVTLNKFGIQLITKVKNTVNGK